MTGTIRTTGKNGANPIIRIRTTMTTTGKIGKTGTNGTIRMAGKTGMNGIKTKETGIKTPIKTKSKNIGVEL